MNIELNKIYNMDCLEGMKSIPDSSIDCIICDLPYGTTVCSWDTIIPFDKLWEQYKRVIKMNGAIILFGAEPFSSYLRISNIKWFRYDIIWKKTKFVNFAMTGKQPGRIHETISVFYEHQPTYNPQMSKGTPYSRHCERNHKVDDGIAQIMGQTFRQDKDNDGTRIPTTVIEFGNNKAPGESLHPTQKPVNLVQYLIRTYTNSGDTVLDNCIGSGTTAIACIRENRNYIGFELCEEYYLKACKRIKEEISQPKLF